MKNYFVPLVILLGLLVNSGYTFGQLSADIVRFENDLKKEPTQYRHYQDLDFLLNSKYLALSAEQRNQIRNALNNAAFSTVTTYSPSERGTRIVIKGTIVDKNNNPVVNAKVVTFQTDASGSYAPTDSVTKRMSEPDSRLYGALRSDRQGHFEIRTIRPGNYPIRYEGRYIPQHVHVVVSAPGYKSVSLQMVFDDDAAMKDIHWQTWAKEQGFPVIKLIPVAGVPTTTPVITLQK